MKLSALPVFGLSLLLGVAASAPANAVAPPSGVTTLNLGYGGGTCRFDTTTGTGVNVPDATHPEIMSATGAFITGCPSGGGSTGPADITLTATTQNNPAAIGDTATVTWRATADVCTYAGTSLPAPLPNDWPASGNACIGAYACSQTHTASPTLTFGGTYTFGLTCTSGANGSGQIEKTVSKAASVVVAGAPPQSGLCTAPPALLTNAGITQQGVAQLGTMDGGRSLNNVDVTQWTGLFGHNWSNNTNHSWPGAQAQGYKIFIHKNQYVAAAFTVPQSYPLTIYTGPTPGPYGTFTTNSSSVTNNVDWAVSISADCGDFMQPTSTSAATHYCYANYTTNQGSGVSWVITPTGTPGPVGTCALHPGQQYYFNIIAAPLNDPTHRNCTGSTCKVNVQPNGGYDSGPLVQ